MGLVTITDYAEQRFFEDTKEHRLDVLHDEGLYRHLRFKQPDTILFYFDIVTWPGYLSVVGDMGDFVFARTRDMIEFFRVPVARELSINPGYWSSKLVAPRPESARSFSQRLYVQHVKEWIDSQEPDEGLRRTGERDLLGELPTNGYEAQELLRNFDHDGLTIADAWEWEMSDFRFDFLWCCWSIVWGIRSYEEGAALQPVDGKQMPS